MNKTERAELISRYLKVNTAIVCDVYDEFGWQQSALANTVTRKTSERGRVAGWAYPIEGRMMEYEGADAFKLEIIDALPAGSVPVWSGTDAKGICLFGDLIAATMQRRGCTGAVVDGGFRDVEAISETGFVVFARYVSPVQSVGRWRVTSHGEPVSLAGADGQAVAVANGDFVLGDEDGVVIIQEARVLKVLARAEEILQQEEEARKLSESGMTAKEMLEKYGHV